MLALVNYVFQTVVLTGAKVDLFRETSKPVMPYHSRKRRIRRFRFFTESCISLFKRDVGALSLRKRLNGNQYIGNTRGPKPTARDWCLRG
jgi:hypothetical protein